MSLKDKWNSIGGVPKTSSRNISKDFWNSFKEFFANKSKFFKKIDESFKANLKLKKDLIEKVNELKSSDEWEKTSKEIQSIQQEWRKIGKKASNLSLNNFYICSISSKSIIYKGMFLA